MWLQFFLLDENGDAGHTSSSLVIVAPWPEVAPWCIWHSPFISRQAAIVPAVQSMFTQIFSAEISFCWNSDECKRYGIFHREESTIGEKRKKLPSVSLGPGHGTPPPSLLISFAIIWSVHFHLNLVSVSWLSRCKPLEWPEYQAGVALLTFQVDFQV